MEEGADYRAAGDAVNINNDVREWPLHTSVCHSVGLHGKTASAPLPHTKSPSEVSEGRMS